VVSADRAKHVPGNHECQAIEHAPLGDIFLDARLLRTRFTVSSSAAMRARSVVILPDDSRL
jgi:hypothetical protein